MQPQAIPVSASLHYQQLEAASRAGVGGPHALVALLYEELLRSLDIVIASASEPRGEAAGVASDIHGARARSILSALGDSLDFDNGATFAPVLARIYRAAAKELASGDRTCEKLAEYRAAFSTISYAWTALAAV